MANLSKLVTGGARSSAASTGKGFRGKSNPPPSSGSSTGGAGQGLVGETAKEIVALEKKVKNNTASKEEIAKLKKLETANERATTRARAKASETRRNRQGIMADKPKKSEDAVATYMKTGKKLEGFTPTPKQVEQYKRNVVSRGAANKKAGGKVMKRRVGGPLKNVPADNKGLPELSTDVRNRMGFAKSGGSISDTKNAKPKSNPKRSSVDPKTGATRGSGAEMVRAKKMGGGQVMKYKKGGMVYKQGGGVVKASNSGDSLIAACYD